MGKRLNIQDAEKAFAERGYVLLETTYKNNNTPMMFTCPNHPDKETYITYKSLKKGCGCMYCGGKVKFSIDEVRSFFEDRGYELLEDTYINATTKMKYRCGEHPDKLTYITLNDLKNNKRGCAYCAGLAKPTFQEVKDLFESRGYTLIDTEYENTHKKMRYICPQHPNKQTLNSHHDLIAGHGCFFCGKEVAASKIHGENHPFWKGGISELKFYLRKQLGEWKQESLEKYDFKCAVTGEKARDLQIHHSKPFYLLRDEALEELKLPVHENIGDYSRVELSSLVSRLQEKHKEEIGIPLRQGIHRLFHHEYGNTVTLADFKEFECRYHAGEFIERRALNEPFWAE